MIMEKVHGVTQPRHGWVRDRGELVEYPSGHYQLRTYEQSRPKYQTIESCHPRDAASALQRALRASAASGETRNPLTLIRTATEAYIKDCRQQGHTEAEAHARAVLKEFMAVCPVTTVRSISREHIYAFRKTLRAKGNSDRTIANKEARVRSWLKFCKFDLATLPKKQSYEETLPTIYAPSELRTILEAAEQTDPYMVVVVNMALKLGLREKEIQFAEWDDIDAHHSVFRVQGKTRKVAGGKGWKFAVKDKQQRDVPIPADLLQTLSEWHEKRPDTTLIVGNDQDQPEGHLLRKLKALARKAGLNCGRCEGCQRKGAAQECENWFLHKFRATFCTRMLRQTDPKTVMYLAGHSDIQTTLAYLAHATGAEMQKHANAVNWLA